MKLLIVDDDRKRRDRLKEYLVDNVNADPADIVVAECVDDAKSILRGIYFDVLILDVVLPKRVNESASAANGLKLLDQIGRASFLKKPEKIVGITAHLSDIHQFRDEFEKHCSVVIEAGNGSDQWRAKIASLLDYTASSRASRTRSGAGPAVLTVHGIQTFGAWQDRLRALVASKTDSISFHNYKYGYFSFLAFLIPFLRSIEVNRLVKHVRGAAEELRGRRLIIFSHSFGTYLVANALEKLLRERLIDTEKVTVVLCGSVLNAHHDWTFQKCVKDLSIINDCGDRDYVLWLSRALVLGVGMAGKTGFYGLNGDRLMNRFFIGGHSLYFKGDEFMSRYWLPIILDDQHRVNPVDFRQPSFYIHGFFEKFVQIVGKLKAGMYFAPIAMLLRHYIIGRGF
ncbi:Response regulator receiver domain-containing protein [Burkholderia sp. YR290]|nr:Response regulator receiver domain-containing protein [Burkholderia sp. YR290]